YKVGKWGIRLENLVIHTKVENTKNKYFGEFLYFKHVTLCPFEISCIDTKMLYEKEKECLNNYNKEVFEKLSPNIGDFQKDLEYLKKIKK
ncbi:M24 family metallopeptidase C-terminal domain-containing protein, partial [Campylobacter jejuni]|uniref:M24 family metallopeptidase C-terminal domain-containing protein n=1 Tax=Campylobacter jejuni TaxID=197 RepID=UPI001E460BB1